MYFLFGAHLDSREHRLRFVDLKKCLCAVTSQHGGGIPFMEVTGKKDVQNGGRSILKMTTGFGLFSSLWKGKFYFFLVFTTNLSYFNSFKLPYKIRLLAFRSPLSRYKNLGALIVFHCYSLLLLTSTKEAFSIKDF